MSGGSTVATDNIGDVQYQRVKLTIGNDGTAVGDVYSGRPLPVDVISGTTAITGGVSVNTPGTITSGSIAVTAGTVGTVGAVGQVHNAGTIAGGTVGVVQNLTNGSIVVTAGTVGTVASIAQVHNAGTMAGGTLGVVQNLTNGSIVVTAGTTGTVGAVGQVHNAGTVAGGTLGVVSNLTNGSVRVTAGTINSGTINAGTVTITDGTQQANTVAGDTGQNGLITLGNRLELSFTTTTAQAVGTADVSNYRSVSVQILTQGGSSTVTFQGSNDGSNWVSVALVQPSNTLSSPSTSTSSANVMFVGNLSFRYFRLNVTGIASGTTSGVIEFFSFALPNLTTIAGQIAINGTQAVAMSSGTITTGTVARVHSVGTINSGTVKLNPRPATNLLNIGSAWGTSSGTAGTIIAAPGAGTSIMINELSIINEGTSNLTAGMGFGTNQQGTLVIARAAMAGNGGVQKSFPTAIGGSYANLPLVIWTTGSGTASFVLSYWTEAQ